MDTRSRARDSAAVKEVGITTIFVTHDQEEALSISDKIVLMDEGIIQQHDDPQNLYLEPNNLFVAQFIGNPVINIMPVTITGDNITADGFEFNKSKLDESRIKSELVDGHYLLGVRPEDVLLVKENALFYAKVNTVELIGRERIVNFSIDGVSAKSIVSIEHVVLEDETISCDFNYPRTFLFKEDGTRVY